MRNFPALSFAVMLLIGSYVATGAQAAVITVGASGCDHTDLQTAIDAAQAGDRLELRTQTFVANVDIDKDLSIVGGYDNCGDASRSSLSTVQGASGAGDSVVEIAGPALTVYLTGLTITGGESDGTGGGLDVLLGSTAIVAGVIVDNNESADGGGIYLDAGATLQQGGFLSVINNTANRGGGIYASDTSLIDLATGSSQSVVIDSNVTSGAGLGGGIYLAGGAELVTDDSGDVTLADNQAISGGGIYAGPDARIDSPNMVVDDNTAFSGGGLYIEGPGGAVPQTAQIFFHFDSRMRRNQALAGGGIYMDSNGGHHLRFEGRLSGNEASTDGGAIYLDGPGDIYLRNAIIGAGNTTPGKGGGIYATDGILRMRYTTVTNNSASSGGGIYAETATLSIDSSSVTSNRASNDGGGLYLDNTNLTSPPSPSGSNGPRFNSNQAENGDGGAIYATGSDIELYWTRIGISGYGNSAPLGNGGGVFTSGGGDLTLVNATVTENSALMGGGVYLIGTGRMEMASEILADAVETRSTTIMPCDPSTLEPNHYCSEVRANSADAGGGILITSSTVPTSTHKFLQTAFIDNVGDFAAALALDNAGPTWARTALFTGNSDNGDDGVESVIRATGDTKLLVDASTVVGNPEVGVVLATDPDQQNDIKGSIFWNNQADFSAGSGVDFSALCNISQDGIGLDSTPGEDPSFITTARGDYRLSDFSDAVDYGCTGIGSAQDLDGISRPMGDSLDLGAFEGTWGNPDFLFSDRFEE